MENDYTVVPGDGSRPNSEENAQRIPVIEEQLRVEKKVVETGKVHISKKVVENETAVTVPLTEESYHVERVPVNRVVDEAPQAVRYEGDTMIIPVMREVLVVQKRYEIVEEIRLTKKVTQEEHTEQVTLLREQVDIDHSRTDERRDTDFK
jgi:uncharacterized protein (TIGR02271 family)